MSFLLMTNAVRVVVVVGVGNGWWLRSWCDRVVVLVLVAVVVVEVLQDGGGVLGW